MISEIDATNQREVKRMPKGGKLDRCVEQVSKKMGKDRAWPICISSTGLKPRRRSKSTTRKRTVRKY